MAINIKQAPVKATTDSLASGEGDFDLLAIYLKARFGSIYAYNLGDGDAGYDAQPWTGDLREAVRAYLLHDLPSDVAGYLFTADAIETDDQASRQSQVDALIDGFEPWEVAQTVRLATLLAVPTLDQLIGHLGAWQWEEDRLDTVTWLEVHAGDRAPWKKLAYANLQRDALQPRSLYVRSPEDLVGALTPPELLTAWHNVVGPAPSDLSEAEWMLLMPSLPKGGPTSPMTETRLVRIRRNLDGMLYRFANKAAWSEVPERYGKNQSILARYTNYKRRGVFAQALASLEHDPSSARLMEWLRSVG